MHGLSKMFVYFGVYMHFSEDSLKFSDGYVIPQSLRISSFMLSPFPVSPNMDV